MFAQTNGMCADYIKSLIFFGFFAPVRLKSSLLSHLQLVSALCSPSVPPLLLSPAGIGAYLSFESFCNCCIWRLAPFVFHHELCCYATTMRAYLPVLVLFCDVSSPYVFNWTKMAHRAKTKQWVIFYVPSHLVNQLFYIFFLFCSKLSNLALAI